MTLLRDVGQKLKGKGQVLKGRLEKESGNPLRGTIEEIKGKANQTMADIKMRERSRRSI
jgi:hypothetical protein